MILCGDERNVRLHIVLGDGDTSVVELARRNEGFESNRYVSPSQFNFR